VVIVIQWIIYKMILGGLVIDRVKTWQKMNTPRFDLQSHSQSCNEEAANLRGLAAFFESIASAWNLNQAACTQGDSAFTLTCFNDSGKHHDFVDGDRGRSR
jgi:hypothetical protein